MKFAYENKQIMTRLAILALVDIILFYIAYQNFAHKIVLTYFYIYLPGYAAIIFLAFINFRFLNFFIRGIASVGDVSDVLRTLPDGYHFINDVVIGHIGNIDSVVIGPTGIWAIEVKSHKGKLTFDEHREILLRSGRKLEKDFLKQAWSEAYTLRDYLREKLGTTYYVQPVIVFSDKRATMRFGFQKQKGVYVINSVWLIELLTTRGNQELSEQVIQTITSTLTRNEKKHWRFMHIAT